jgi:hypothetical protein
VRRSVLPLAEPALDDGCDLFWLLVDELGDLVTQQLAFQARIENVGLLAFEGLVGGRADRELLFE